MVGDQDSNGNDSGEERSSSGGRPASLSELYDSLTAVDNVLDPMPISVVAVDRDSRIILANERLLRQFGFTRADLLRRPLDVIFPGTKIDCGWNEQERVYAIVEHGGERLGASGDLTGQRRDASEMNLKVEAHPHEFGDDIIIFLSVLDIAEARKAKRAMRQREELLRMVISGIPAMVSAKDKQGRYLLVNEYQSEILGVSAADAIGKTTSEVLGDEAGAAIDALDRRLTQGTGLFFSLEEKYPDSDGRERIWLTTKSAIRADNGSVDKVISVSIDISEKKFLEERAEGMANYDALTGLPNRPVYVRRLQDTLGHAKRARTRAAIAVFDLDNLRGLDSEHGEGLADYLLRRASIRMSPALGEDDVAARVGNDSFAVILSETASGDAAKKTAAKMLESLTKPFQYRENELTLDVKMGVAVYPDDGRDARELMQAADNAIRRARDAGRPKADKKTDVGAGRKRRRDLLAGIRGALEHERFELHFQPETSCVDGRILRAEALIRWNDPNLGEIEPEELISTAEDDSELSEAIGEWTVRQACLSAAAWAKEGVEGVPVSVNVSASQFFHPEFADLVSECLSAAELDPSMLAIEVTEEAAIMDADMAESMFGQLAELGVATTLDRFGGGQTSLISLHKFSVDSLKLDRTLIADLTNMASVVEAAVKLGKGMGKRVVGTGVETGKHHAFLRDVGCDAVTGFHLSRPSSLADFAKLFRDRGGHIVVNGGGA